MDIDFDYINRKLIVAGRPHSLDKLEDFILTSWYPLAQRYFIKAITVCGKTKFTYDWGKLLSIAAEGGIIIEEFLHSEDVLFTKEKPKPSRQNDLFTNL